MGGQALSVEIGHRYVDRVDEWHERIVQWLYGRVASSPGPAQKIGKGAWWRFRVFFVDHFEEPIRLQNETTRNVIPSHAHKAKSADYAIW